MGSRLCVKVLRNLVDTLRGSPTYGSKVGSGGLIGSPLYFWREGQSMSPIKHNQTIALGADHAGYELKNLLKESLLSIGYDVIDFGTNSGDSVDYPDFGRAVAEALADGRAGRGLLVCGTGIGISIAANRFPAVRAALCRSALDAQSAREHNDANVLALGARITGVEAAKDCLQEFLSTEFDGGRHVARVDKLSELVQREVEEV